MASLIRTMKRSMAFKGMNKQQRLMWSSQHGGQNNPSVKEKLKKTMQSKEGVRNCAKS